MKTYLQLSRTHRTELPPEFRHDDVRFTETLAEYFILAYTRPGDVVFDPFAGFGTTLVVAEALGRRPAGIEFNEQRYRYIHSRMRDTTYLMHGDTRQLGTYDLPPFDLSLTSPPYMSEHEEHDPLTAYSQPSQGYVTYLEQIGAIYTQMATMMKPQGHVVIEVANLKNSQGITTLAWDIAGVVAEALRFEGEIVIAWDESYGYGYDHSYALVFSKG